MTTRLAITGHRGLTAALEAEIDRMIRAAVAENGSVVGVSCLADGADAVFAQAVLDAGGALVAVLPASRYRDTLPESYRPVYDGLLARAGKVVQLEYVTPDPHAYMEAGERMVDESDALLAVWDGLPGRGPGGTADVVAYARSKGVPVTVLWPEGAVR
ncbi:hypothetical protein SAMN04488074_102508 [Lentzea albidocapillata subsp. violacea]|uniref:DNA recombination-mediator protein A n=1 Tax=Lentzea albidocapillata subsp. violacea TaxID=128104 RepID=A0A1G8V522_9PSEU|nr:hypothetical protein [Lentzea albidocapillata]SDJ60947.1 hypothetical protein SAMN04488074_102508 [Lentzea albidocapillata subsp. violacea]